MAGKEARGAAEAEASLFQGRPYILTSPSPELEQIVASIRARLVVIPAEEHDRLVAFTSHLPQIVSTALAQTVGMEQGAARVAGPASMDMTRLALSPYDIWHDIFATNAPNIDTALGAYIAKLEALRVRLRKPQMENEFEIAAAAASELRDSSRGKGL